MSSPPDRPDDPTRPTTEPDADEDRAAILARRRSFVMRAVAAVGAAALGAAAADCAPAACLRYAVDTGPQDSADDASDAMDVARDDGTPMPCLSRPIDAGEDAADATSDDGAPMPCLTPKPPDSGRDAPDDDGAPMPCLSPPVDGGR